VDDSNTTANTGVNYLCQTEIGRQDSYSRCQNVRQTV